MITIKSTNKLRTLFALAVVTVVAGAALPATYTVTNTNDSGTGSLRKAIESANTNLGPDRIEFSIDGDGPYIIWPEIPLPELTEEVVIDGYSQPGSQRAISTSNAVLMIVLDGSSPSSWYHLGLIAIGPNASACEIRGLVISNYNKNGIFIESGANGNVIEGNYIGTDYTGTASQGNGECGIFIKSSNNRIGGTTPDARNVISCNGREGIIIHGSAASGNQVLGNFIGTDASGTSHLPNDGIDVAINDAPDNVVGGTEPGSRNVITEVHITSHGAMNNQVIGNYIGVNASGTRLLEEGEYFDTQGALIKEASHNVIGPDNVISGHVRGVHIWPDSSYNSVGGNYIGTDATGQEAIGFEWDAVTVNGSHNTIEDNVICASKAHGIYVSRATASHNVLANNIIGMNNTIDEALPNKNGIIINSATNTTISGNLIACNEYNGIGISNDLPGTPAGHFAVGNRITQNAIYDNGGLGIELVPDGVTPNDEGDSDVGPNKLMNFPVLASAMATPGQLIVKGTIDTPNLMSVTLEFFANSEADSSGNGEGEIYLGSAKPNATGAFTAALPAVSPGMWISATATDGEGNTSEFAFSIEAKGPGGGQLLLDGTIHEGNAWSLDGGTGTILLEVWEDIGIRDEVVDFTSNPRYPDDPSWWMELTSFDFWDLGSIRYGYPLEKYGSRVRGYLCPQTDGDYTFWIASDNCSELWLSFDDNPDNAVLIAEVRWPDTWTDHYGWDENPWQESDAITLEGGQKYYIMTLHKEGVGGDGVCVAWQGPDCLEQAVIDGQFLSPYELTPEEQIERILRFVDRAVDEGTLQGEGPGKSAQNLLNALRNMLEVAADLVEAGAYEGACDQLMAAYQKTDDDPTPPDFVSGFAAPELAIMLLDLMASLGCE